MNQSAIFHVGIFQVSPFDKREEADRMKQGFAVGNSDHLTMLKAYKVIMSPIAHGKLF